MSMFHGTTAHFPQNIHHVIFLINRMKHYSSAQA